MGRPRGNRLNIGCGRLAKVCRVQAVWDLVFAVKGQKNRRIKSGKDGIGVKNDLVANHDGLGGTRGAKQTGKTVTIEDRAQQKQEVQKWFLDSGEFY